MTWENPSSVYCEIKVMILIIIVITVFWKDPTQDVSNSVGISSGKWSDPVHFLKVSR